MQGAVKQQVLEILGYFWQHLFLDSEFVEAWATTVAVPLDDLNADFEGLSDYMSRYTIPIKEPKSIRLFVFDEEFEDLNANRYGDEGLEYGGGAIYGQENTAIDSRRFPINPGYEPRYLATSIDDPGDIMQLGVDYEIDDGWITFIKNPEILPSLQTKAKTGADQQTYLQFLLWGFQVEEDINALCTYFGTMAKVCGPSDPWTKEIVNVAWDLRVSGASVRNVQRVMAVLTHTDYVYTAGKVLDVYTAGDRICVQTDTQVYTAPIEARALVVKGDSITEDQAIFDTFSIHLATEDIPGDDFDGLSLGPGYMPALRAPILFPNARVDIDKIRHPGWFTVRSQ
jgi:hypothetical protein